MTKNGSNSGKTRIRAYARRHGVTHRQAGRALADQRAAWIAASRAICHSPENLRDARDTYLLGLSEHGSDLPEIVKVCLYAFTDRLARAR